MMVQQQAVNSPSLCSAGDEIKQRLGRRLVICGVFSTGAEGASASQLSDWDVTPAGYERLRLQYQ